MFAHGYGVTPADYAPLLTRIAAAGYVVAAPTYPLLSGQPAGPTDTVGWDDLFPDTRFVITQVLARSTSGDPALGGLIDPNRIAVAGHSDGAAIAYGIGYVPFKLDPRVRAVVSYAADLQYYGLYQPNGRPILHVLSDQDVYNPYGDAITWDRTVLQQPKTVVSLWNASHEGPFMEPVRSALRVRRARDDRLARHDVEGATPGPAVRVVVRGRPSRARGDGVARRQSSSGAAGVSSGRREVHDGAGTFGVVGVEHDVDVVELGLGRLGDDGGLFALGSTFERVAHAEQSRGDHAARAAAPELVDRPFPVLAPASALGLGARRRPRARRRARPAPGGVRRSRPHVRTARRIASPGAGGAGGADPTGDDLRRHARGRARRHPVRRLGPRRLRSAVGRRRPPSTDDVASVTTTPTVATTAATGRRRRGDHHHGTVAGPTTTTHGRAAIPARCPRPTSARPRRAPRSPRASTACGRRSARTSPSSRCRSSSRRARTSR